MPLRYWDDTFRTADYLRNRLCTPNLKGNTPFEVLFNTCLIIMLKRSAPPIIPTSEVLANTNSNLVECTFIGYSLNNKGYKCLDPNERVIIPEMSSLMKIHFLCQKGQSLLIQIIHNMRRLHPQLLIFYYTT